jgi:hypothetical protein
MHPTPAPGASTRVGYSGQLTASGTFCMPRSTGQCNDCSDGGTR